MSVRGAVRHAMGDLLGNGERSGLTFVLTLALAGTGRPGSDLVRAGILFDSVLRYVPCGDIADFLIVTRPDDIREVSCELERYQGVCRLKILDETKVCPPLLRNPDTTNNWPEPNIGWFRQQIIKLACHRLIRTPFYMALDSDIIFKKPLKVNALLPDNKAVVNTETFGYYTSLYDEVTAEHERRVKLARYKDAERVLRCKRPQEHRPIWYGETPVVLARDIVASLTQYLQRVWARPWQDVLLEQLPWTEYPLYFLYAEISGLLNRYHKLAGPDAVLSLSQSLWWPPERYQDRRCLDTWPVRQIFDPTSPGVAVAVQSYLNHDPILVRRTVGDFL